MAGFAFVIVSYRSERDLIGLLGGLEAVSRALPECRAVVVDCSGMSSEWREALESHAGLPLDFVDPGRNVGFAAGANLGFRAAQADVVTFVNPDFDVEPHGVASVLQAGSTSDAAAWTGVIRNADGSVQRNTAPSPKLHRQVLEYLFSVDTRLPPPRRERSVGVISGAFVCVRADAFRAVGGFDESYPLYMEDVDLSARLSSTGRLVQFPIPVGTHTGGSSAAFAPGATSVLLHASRVQYYRTQSRAAGTVERATVLLGCALRHLVFRRRSSVDLTLLARATAPGFPLASLLPPHASDASPPAPEPA